MKIRLLLLISAGIILILFSCASGPGAYAQIDGEVHAGSFVNAFNALENPGGRARKTIYNPKNEILLHLDRGMLAHYAEMYRESSSSLELAELLIEEAFTKSISQEIGTYLLNDNVRDYSGEDYEDLYCNVFNSLNYYHENNLEGSLVEIRRLNEKLNYLADKYERAKKIVLDSNDQIDPGTLPMEASKFSNSALARYLGMLFYRGTGRFDSARIDSEEIYRAYDLAPDVYYHSIPSSVADELVIPPGMARLNIIAFTGLSPIKEEENIIIPLPLAPPNHFARLAFPKMVNRPRSITRAEAILDSGEIFPLELIEDMGAVARETFKSRHGLIVLKTTARTIIKNTTSAVAAAVISERKDESLGALVGILGKIFTEVSEQADTRLSRYFPSHALVGGLNLDPGDYFLTVNYYGIGGLVTSERRNISVRERSLNIEEFICLK